MKKVFLDLVRAKERFSHQTKIRGIDLQKESPVSAINLSMSSEQDVVVGGELVSKGAKKEVYHPKITFHSRTSMLVGTECNCAEKRMCSHAFALISTLEKQNASTLSPTGVLDISSHFVSDRELEEIRDKSDEWIKRYDAEKKSKAVDDQEKILYHDFIKLLYLKNDSIPIYSLQIIVELSNNEEVPVCLSILDSRSQSSTQVDFSFLDPIMQSKRKVRIGGEFVTFKEDDFDVKELNIVYMISRVGMENNNRYVITQSDFSRIVQLSLSEGIHSFYQRGEDSSLTLSDKPLKLHSKLSSSINEEVIDVTLSYKTQQDELFEGLMIPGTLPSFISDNTLYLLDSTISKSIWALFNGMSQKGLPSTLFPSFYSYTIDELPESITFDIEQSLVESINETNQELSVKVNLSWDSGDIVAEITFCYGSASEKLKEGAPLTFPGNRSLVRDLKKEKYLSMRLTQWCQYSTIEQKFVIPAESFSEYFTHVYLVMKEEIEFNIFKGLQKKIIDGRLEGKASFRESSNVNFLEVAFDFPNLKNSIEIDELRRILIEGNPITQRKKGGWVVDFEQGDDKRCAARNLLRMMEELNIKEIDKSVKTVIPKWNLIPLLDLMEQGEFNVPPAIAKLGEQYRLFIEGTERKVAVSKGFTGTLREYQLEGFEWLFNLQNLNFHGVLADDMGLGKTIQTIALLETTREKKINEGSISLPSLIVCPTSLVSNWKQEIDKFSSNLTSVVLEGSRDERDKLLKSLDKFDIIITSYSILKRDVEALSGQHWLYLVLDEAQHIKNPGTQNAISAKAIDSEHRLVLTGTPIENGLRDLWSLFDFLMPGYLSKKSFSSLNEDVDSIIQLKKRVAPFILRRVKKDVLDDLPEVTSIVHRCEMGDKQKALYVEVREKLISNMDNIIDENGEGQSKMHILAGLTRLKQVCCDPQLLGIEGKWPSAKLDLLEEIVEEIVDGKHKAVIFSQYVSMLKIIEGRLKERGILFESLYGETKNRMDVVNRFNNTPSIPLFLISLKAGGVGLNLTGADRVILYDPWWNSAVEEQAIARVHRIGQKNAVMSYKLIAKGTIEEKIMELQESKRDLFEGWIEQGDKNLMKLGWDELKGLLRE